MSLCCAKVNNIQALDLLNAFCATDSPGIPMNLCYLMPVLLKLLELVLPSISP